MDVFSDGHAPSSTWDALLSQVDNGRPAGVQLDPVGLTHPGRRLWHENASGGGSQLSPGGHCGGFKPVREVDPVKYCRLCFGVGKKCRCSNVPHQTPSQASALWMPLTMSYATMASSTETTASSSVGGVPPPRYPPPGLPPVDSVPMDMLLAPTSENLLATAGVGRGSRGLRQPQTPTAPGLRPVRPTAPQQ